MNQYKDETFMLCRTKGWDKAPVSTVWLLFTEEIGELASAIRQYQRSFRKTGLKKDKGIDIETEMGDVFSYLFQLAYMLNVDLDHMWSQHREKVASKFYKESNINGVCGAH
jgi:NTP pyrophosphatase (non-canonical NTP hydrolase)